MRIVASTMTTATSRVVIREATSSGEVMMVMDMLMASSFTIPHHSTKTMVLGAIFIVAQKQGVLPVNLADLFAGLVLSAFAFRITTTYFLSMKVGSGYSQTGNKLSKFKLILH